MKHPVKRQIASSIVLMFFLQSLISVYPQEADRGPADEIVRLEAEARRESEYAAGIRERAREYDTLAREAKNISDTATNPVVKETWSDTARRHEAEAQRLRSVAAEFEEKARKLMDQVARLKAMPVNAKPDQPPVVPPRSNVSRNPNGEQAGRSVPVEELLGKWKNQEDGSIVTIEQLYLNDPRRKNELKFSGKHDWGGIYDGRSLSFTRTPKFEEMSSAAPDWARKAVEGQLRWTLKFKVQGECDRPFLEGEWFPGELQWTETKDSQTGEPISRKAEVTGSRGAPRRINLTKEGADTTLDLRDRPNVVIWPDRKRSFNDYFTANFSLNSVSKTQPFIVLVRMPRGMADQVGPTLEVSVSAAKSGNTSRLPLKRYEYPNRPSVYITDEPVMIADPGSAPSIANPFSKRVRLDLKATNEDKVTVSYGDAKAEFTVYDSPIAQGLAAHEEGFRAMLALYNSIIYEVADPRVRMEANRKIQMIKNARHLINDYQPKPLPIFYVDFTGKRRQWEKITDLMRLAIGERYHELLQEKIDPASYRNEYGKNLTLSNESRDYFYKELGITLTSQRELDELLRAFDEGATAFEDRLINGLLPEFSMGLYQVVMFTHYINPLTQRIEQFLILIYGVDFFGEPVDKTQRILTAVGLVSELLLRAPNVANLKEFKVRLSTPPRLRTGIGGQSRGAFVKGAGANSFDGARMPRNLGGSSFYGKAEKVNYPDNILTPLQRRPDTCLLMVLNGHLREAGLPHIPEDLSVAFAEALGIFQEGKGTNRFLAVRYLEDFGVKAQIVPANISAIEFALKRGLGVNVAALTARARHALRIRRIQKSPNGKKYVFFEDSWNGNQWSMEADEFCKLYDSANVMMVDISGKISKGPLIPL